MANLTVTGTTAANTLTENSSTINRERGVGASSESVTILENVAVLNATRIVAGTTEVVSITGTPATVGIYKATVSTVLSGIGAVTVTAITDLMTLVDTFYASEQLTGAFDFDLSALIIAGDSTEVVWNETLTDVINVSDTQTHDWIANLGDTATATEVAGPVIWDANLWPLPAVGSWHEEIVVFLSEFITNTVNATDSFAEISRTISYGDTFTATEDLTHSVEHTETVVAVITAEEVLIPGAFEELTTGNVILATSTYVDSVSNNQSHVDTFFATDTIVSTSRVNTALTDTIVALEELIVAAGVSNNTLCGELTAGEVLWASDFGALAWVLNTETAGLSTYDNFGFNSIAAVDGVLYGTSPEGVFAMNADLDQSRFISARVKTGMLDFDIKTTKRISDIFIGYTGGRLSYEVEAYDGPQDLYTYEMPERDSDAPRNNRVKPGKGLSARYWRFGIENIDGADFQLHDQTAVVAASKRRL